MGRHKFRSIYVVQPCHDFSLLAKHAQQVRFMTTGTERFQELGHAIREGLSGFDPEKDAVVAVGKVNACFLAGAVLRELTEEPVWLGVYGTKDGEKVYEWEQVEL